MALDMNVALKINAGVTGQQAVDQLRTSMDKLNGAADSVSKGFGLAKAAVGAFAVMQVAQAVLNFTRSTIDAADALNDMADRSGIAVGTLSELEYAAKLNGSSLDEMQAALTKVAVKATDAATGNKTASVAFDALGIAVKNADGSMRSSLQITEDIGDAFQGISDPTLKSALAVEIFGKSGAKLIPVLENMRAARQEARDLGAVVGEDFVKASADFNDNVDRMSFMMKGFAGTILADVLPALSEMFKEMSTGIKVFGSFSSAMWNIGTTNPFRTPKENAIAYGKDLDKLAASVARMRASGDFNDAQIAAINEPRLEALRKTVEYYEKIAGIQRAGAGRGSVNPDTVKAEQPDAAAIMAKLSGAKALEEADRAAKKSAEERLQILKALGDEVVKLTSGEEALTIAKLKDLGATPKQIAQAEELMRSRSTLKASEKEQEEATKKNTQQVQERTQVIKSLADEITRMTQGEDALTIARLKGLGATPLEIAQAEELLQKRTDIKFQDKENEDAIAAAIKERAQETEYAANSAQKLADAGKRIFEETRTPAEKLRSQFDELNQLLEQGVIDADTYTRAVTNAQDAFDDLGKKGKDTMDELKDAVDGWGRQATDAFVEFAFNGKASFGDLVGSVLKDMARMVIQTQIMAPLMSAAKSFFFAGGGVMSSAGSMPLKTYAGGGIANSPQMAVFGEGSMPEAYVPLPDGRTIPVTMQGGAGGNTSVVVNVSVESGKEKTDDQGAGSLGRVIAGAVKQELINQKRPGGLLAA